jgi:hypothetical protein
MTQIPQIIYTSSMFRSGNRRWEAVVAAQPPKDNHPDQADSGEWSMVVVVLRQK